MHVYLFGFLLSAAILAALLAGRRARAKAETGSGRLHSRPLYHALNAAIWTGVPAFVFLILWLLGENSVINSLVLASYPGSEALDVAQRAVLISQIRQLAAGNAFQPPTPELLAAVDHLRSLETLGLWALAAVVASLAVVGMALGWRVIERHYRARHSVERAATLFMMFSSLVAILTTFGIVGSLIFEAAQFFSMVPISEFLFGLRWEPQIAIRAIKLPGKAHSASSR